MGKIYLGDGSVVIEILALGADAPVDLSTSTVRKYRVTKPDGTKVIWPTDGNLEYLDDKKTLTYSASVDELNQLGVYVIVPYAEWTSASPHRGEPYKLKIWEEGK